MVLMLLLGRLMLLVIEVIWFVGVILCMVWLICLKWVEMFLMWVFIGMWMCIVIWLELMFGKKLLFSIGIRLNDSSIMIMKLSIKGLWLFSVCWSRLR